MTNDEKKDLIELVSDEKDPSKTLRVIYYDSGRKTRHISINAKSIGKPRRIEAGTERLSFECGVEMKRPLEADAYMVGDVWNSDDRAGPDRINYVVQYYKIISHKSQSGPTPRRIPREGLYGLVSGRNVLLEERRE